MTDPTNVTGQMHSRIGSDEAGKGPVLGPMVCAAVRAPPSVIPDDIDDSKRLDVSTRRQLQETLRSHTAVDIGTVIIPVTRIDDPRTNMNTITVNGHIEAIIDIGEVAESTDTIIADASDVSESRFARRIKTGLTEATDAAQYSQCTVEARHGADEDDPLVAAASVIAKVRRDEEITTLAKEYETYGPIGSGYPSDQTTREFLQRYTRATGELPDCARRSWATADQILETVEQSSLSDI